MFPLLKPFAGVYIPTYLLVLSVAYSLGIVWAVKRAERANLDRNIMLDICLAIMLGGFIGARLFFVFYEDWSFYRQNLLSIFKIWQGGFVFYGGVVGAALACFWFIRKKSLRWQPYADALAPILAFGYGLGRVGCFTAGCCYGGPTDLPWAVYFPPGVLAPSGIGLHPTQLYATAWEWSLVLILLSLSKTSLRSGQLFWLWVVGHGMGRWLMESLRNDPRGQFIFGLSISTWLSWVLILVGSYCLWQTQRSKTPH